VTIGIFSKVSTPFLTDDNASAIFYFSVSLVYYNVLYYYIDNNLDLIVSFFFIKYENIYPNAALLLLF
jgi:hypothetical protein